MYKAFGVSVFLLGSMGLLYQQWYARQQRMQFLQEMQTCLLRMQQAVLKRNLPVMAVLAMESERKVTGLCTYFNQVRLCLLLHNKETMEAILQEELTPELKAMTKEEERVLFMQALCSLFSASVPGEAQDFAVFYEAFSHQVMAEERTRKERGKVTACTTGMGLMMLLLLLL